MAAALPASPATAQASNTAAAAASAGQQSSSPMKAHNRIRRGAHHSANGHQTKMHQVATQAFPNGNAPNAQVTHHPQFSPNGATPLQYVQGASYQGFPVTAQTVALQPLPVYSYQAKIDVMTPERLFLELGHKMEQLNMVLALINKRSPHVTISITPKKTAS